MARDVRQPRPPSPARSEDETELDEIDELETLATQDEDDAPEQAQHSINTTGQQPNNGEIIVEKPDETFTVAVEPIIISSRETTPSASPPVNPLGRKRKIAALRLDTPAQSTSPQPKRSGKVPRKSRIVVDDEREDGDDEIKITPLAGPSRPRRDLHSNSPSYSQSELKLPSTSSGRRKSEQVASSSSSRTDSLPRRIKASSRLRPTVQIPLLPLSRLSPYALLDHAQGPTKMSRRKLPRADPDSDSDLSSPGGGKAKARPKRAAAVKAKPAIAKYPTRGTHSSPDFGGYSSAADGAGEGSELDTDLEDPDADVESSSDLSSLTDGEEEVVRRRSKRGKADRNDQTFDRRHPRRSTRQSKSPNKLGTSRRRSRRSTSTMRPQRKATQKAYNEDDDEEGESEIGSQGSEVDDAISEDSDGYQLDFSSDEEGPSGGRKGDDPEEDLTLRHRGYCEKCGREPADQMLAAFKRKKGGGRKRKDQDDLVPDDERAQELQGWLKCNKCCITSHWFCLGPQQQKEVKSALADIEGPPQPGERKRTSVRIDETFTFTCTRCEAGGTCMVCHEGPTPLEEVKEESKGDGHGDVDMDGKAEEGKKDVKDEKDEKDAKKEVTRYKPFFRCQRCKQASHYEHLRDPFSDGQNHDLNDKAEAYQMPYTRHDPWLCHCCREWVWDVDIICAWRPFPPNAKEPKRKPDEKADYKADLPREYLVKWKERGFRHATWVTHGWLKVATAAKLRIFLERGPQLALITDETLAARGDDMDMPTIANVFDAEQPKSGRDQAGSAGPPPDANAEASIPEEWRTIDRILDLCLMAPKKAKSVKPGKTIKRVMSASNSPSLSAAASPAPMHDYPDGLMPPDVDRIDIDEWETQTGRTLTEDDVDEVAKLSTWCFVKWDDLQYDQSCWDTPPPIGSSLYPAFVRALKRYLQARQVQVPVLSASQIKQREAVASANKARPPREQPDCVVGGKLMDFQLEGVQWLITKHFRRESCILADDMGLGKTVQVASVLGYLGSERFEIFPLLVVVPNSTITNWVREFEKWVPHMRVVPYYGEKASRKVINKYELYHKGQQGKAAGMKAHVVLTTYDMITSTEFRVFSMIPRWEMVIVDEGQRLKSDSNLIFNRLKSLNSVHRVLLTGTPLNNNLRELFNLLNFLDPDEFGALEELEQRFENLSEGLVQELHEMIAPYILRRIKADVLKLPPKIEIIVPISLAPLQRNVYKSVLERNADVIKAIAEAKAKKARKAMTDVSGGGVVIKKGKKVKKGVDVVAAVQGDEVVEEVEMVEDKVEGGTVLEGKAKDAIEAITAAAAGKDGAGATIAGSSKNAEINGMVQAKGEAKSATNGDPRSNGLGPVNGAVAGGGASGAEVVKGNTGASGHVVEVRDGDANDGAGQAMDLS